MNCLWAGLNSSKTSFLASRLPLYFTSYFFQTQFNDGNFCVSEEMKLSLNLTVATVSIVPIHNCQSPKPLAWPAEVLLSVIFYFKNVSSLVSEALQNQASFYFKCNVTNYLLTSGSRIKSCP